MPADSPLHSCTRCGMPTEGTLADIYICDNCYSIRGACCASEFEEEASQATESIKKAEQPRTSE